MTLDQPPASLEQLRGLADEEAAQASQRGALRPTTSMAPAEPPPGEGEGFWSRAARTFLTTLGQSETARQAYKGGATPEQALEQARQYEAPGGISAMSMAKQMVAPLAGTLAGRIIGRRFGPAGEIGGEMLGSAAGEGFNQATGITEPNVRGLLQASTAPLLGRSVGGVVQTTSSIPALQ
jgi:hypothetical protein